MKILKYGLVVSQNSKKIWQHFNLLLKPFKRRNLENSSSVRIFYQWTRWEYFSKGSFPNFSTSRSTFTSPFHSKQSAKIIPFLLIAFSVRKKILLSFLSPQYFEFHPDFFFITEIKTFKFDGSNDKENNNLQSLYIQNWNPSLKQKSKIAAHRRFIPKIINIL